MDPPGVVRSSGPVVDPPGVVVDPPGVVVEPPRGLDPPGVVVDVPPPMRPERPAAPVIMPTTSTLWFTCSDRFTDAGASSLYSSSAFDAAAPPAALDAAPAVELPEPDDPDDPAEVRSDIPVLSTFVSLKAVVVDAAPLLSRSTHPCTVTEASEARDPCVVDDDDGCDCACTPM